MVILIYGDQYPIISKRCKKVVSSILGDEIDDFSYVKINAKEVLVQDIVYECSLLPLGGKKVVEVDYPYFLATMKDKVDIEKDQDYDCLINFINKDDNEDVVLLFFIEQEKLNERNAVTKALLKNAKIYEEKGYNIEDLRTTAIPYFAKKGCVITQEAVDLLFERIGDSVASFISEAEKLCLYKKNIDVNDVAVMVPVPLEQNALMICNSLITNHSSKAIRIFRDLLTQKEEPVRILNLLATQFRTFTEVCYLYKVERLSQPEIDTALKYKPGRSRYVCRDIVNLSYDNLCNIMDYLFNLDCKIKGMEVDPVNGLELFMINFNDIKNRTI